MSPGEGFFLFLCSSFVFCWLVLSDLTPPIRVILAQAGVAVEGAAPGLCPGSLTNMSPPLPFCFVPRACCLPRPSAMPASTSPAMKSKAWVRVCPAEERARRVAGQPWQRGLCELMPSLSWCFWQVCSGIMCTHHP